MLHSLQTPWTAAHQTSLSFTISQSSLRFLLIELVMLPNHLILCRPLLLLASVCPCNRVLSNELAFCIRWPKYWNFSFTASNEYSGLISFRIDWFDLLCCPRDSQESSPASQIKGINSLVPRILYASTLTSISYSGI